MTGDSRQGTIGTASRATAHDEGSKMDVTVVLIRAALLAGVGALVTKWVLDDEHVPPALADERLLPKAPRKTRPDNRIRATRTLLEAYLAEELQWRGEAEVIKRMPVIIAEASIPGWMSNTIELDEPINGWLLRYTGGPTATAVAFDGTRLLIDATVKPEQPHDGSLLALVRIAGGEGRLLHVRGKRHEAESYFREVGFGRFRRYVKTTSTDPKRRTICSNFLSLEGA